MKIRTLHGVSLGLAIVTAVVLLASVAYASVRFAPDLIEILGKKTNDQGRLEYSVPSFADCASTNGGPKLDTFEVKPTAKLSDEDVKKTLQAKCELLGIDKFASDTWPTYGQHAKWQDGDDIFYTRPDILGVVQKIDKHGVTISYDSGAPANAKTYKTFQNKDLQAYVRNQRTGLGNIKHGDLVFAIERVSEKYYQHPPFSEPNAEGIQYYQGSQPHALGIVAVVKMTLPPQYYYGMQQYVREVRPCQNNPGERCSNGPGGSSIDVFPREGGEGARNPDLRATNDSTTWRDINGIITAIDADKFTIRSGSGAIYRVYLEKAVIDTYNTAY
ncbi:MAG: hypothetical protein ABWY71_00750, partial [Candidatus Saccharimonadales bacterium]